jgi:hypothetical protein
MSLASLETGENLFAIESTSNPYAERFGIPLSKMAFHFVAGILRHASSITAGSSPTYRLESVGAGNVGSTYDITNQRIIVTEFRR